MSCFEVGSPRPLRAGALPLRVGAGSAGSACQTLRFRQSLAVVLNAHSLMGGLRKVHHGAAWPMKQRSEEAARQGRANAVWPRLRPPRRDLEVIHRRPRFCRQHNCAGEYWGSIIPPHLRPRRAIPGPLREPRPIKGAPGLFDLDNPDFLLWRSNHPTHRDKAISR
jgi:hypothetical protein